MSSAGVKREALNTLVVIGAWDLILDGTKGTQEAALVPEIGAHQDPQALHKRTKSTVKAIAEVMLKSSLRDHASIVRLNDRMNM